MNTPWPLWLAWRTALGNERSQFVSFIAWVSMIGIALGVLVLIVVLSVMNGFDRALKQKILGALPHATLIAQSPVNGYQGTVTMLNENHLIQQASPFIEMQGMLTHSGRVSGVMLQGIEPVLEQQISVVPKHIVEGDFSHLKSKSFGIAMGRLLAQELGLALGDNVTLVLPEASVSLAGVMPRFKRFTLVALYEVGSEIDRHFAYIHIDDAARMQRLPVGSATHFRLAFDDVLKVPSIRTHLINDLPKGFYYTDWTQTHGSLFQAIQMEKKLIALLLLMIVAVAAFNIVSTLVMMVNEKKPQIAILRTMGASRQSIMAIFLSQGLTIGGLGVTVGALLGIPLAYFAPQIVAAIESSLGMAFLDPNVYFVSSLPSYIIWQDCAVIIVVAFVLSLLAALYPAWKASKILPVEVLRNE